MSGPETTVRVLARWLLSGKSMLNTLRTLGCCGKKMRGNRLWGQLTFQESEIIICDGSTVGEAGWSELMR